MNLDFVDVSSQIYQCNTRFVMLCKYDGQKLENINNNPNNNQTPYRTLRNSLVAFHESMYWTSMISFQVQDSLFMGSTPVPYELGRGRRRAIQGGRALQMMKQPWKTMINTRLTDSHSCRYFDTCVIFLSSFFMRNTHDVYHKDFDMQP